MNVAGKTVVITGASRGIGAEAARVFAAAGANVALIARSSDAIEKLSAEIGAQAIALTCDVASYASVEGAIAKAKETFGSVDILINNAGVIEPISHLASADPDEWGAVIDINLKGVFNGMRAVLPMMIASGGGSILTISSGAAHGPVEAWSHYCASKAAVKMLTECVNKENGADGIRAIGLSPGTVATQMQVEIKASGINPVSQLDWDVHIPADWPARALLWLCGSDADQYCGQELSLRNEDLRKRVGLI
ncbi:SDR family oxidoreductase [Ascidiaceihabitans sp.]|nr:SDR family oxidoreductase [Paracoccaceae bacterium]MDB4073834.1 SDR family oxidoreductase [Ascidiaceihabitans sp.]MDB4211266.1 SDR family oxidoreductase [Ascidiaceihabitans sp.]MDB9945024.1 SDR family oxidoreductase [Ascidiaceihabitans sp.]HCI05794.1 short-chain dehydrogenase [Sulfitobacter sp.]